MSISNELSSTKIGEDINHFCTKLTRQICKGMNQKKTEVNVYINCVKKVSNQHIRSQCAKKSINLPIYLSHLTIGRKKTKSRPLIISRVKGHTNQLDIQQHRDAIDIHTLKSFSSDFLPQKPLMPATPLPFQFHEIGKNEPSDSKKKRISNAVFLKALINLKENTFFDWNNVFDQYRKYDSLMKCEMEVLRWLFLKDKVEKQLFLKYFPFMLEEQLITIATYYFQGKLDISKEKIAFQWIHNATTQNMFINISFSLFSLANYNADLLNILLSLLHEENDCVK